MEVVDFTEHLPISSRSLKQIQETTNKDSTLQTLKQYILSGRPKEKSKCHWRSDYMYNVKMNLPSRTAYNLNAAGSSSPHN